MPNNYKNILNYALYNNKYSQIAYINYYYNKLSKLKPRRGPEAPNILH